MQGSWGCRTQLAPAGFLSDLGFWLLRVEGNTFPWEVYSNPAIAHSLQKPGAPASKSTIGHTVLSLEDLYGFMGPANPYHYLGDWSLLL